MMKPEDLTTNNMSELLSEVIRRSKSGESVWDARLDPAQRVSVVQRLAKALGPRYEAVTFENYEIYERKAPGERLSQAEAYQQVKAFCDEMPERLRTGGGLVFFGKPGSGKDHMMIASMYWAVLKYGFSVEWHDGLTLAQTIRGRVAKGGDETEFLKRFEKPQILAISDPIPPKGDTSQYVADTLQRVVDRRYRACKSTWATINVRDGKEAEERLAAPVVDRLRHGSLCLQCQWESWRKRG